MHPSPRVGQWKAIWATGRASELCDLLVSRSDVPPRLVGDVAHAGENMLCPSELEVLALYADGLRPAEIAVRRNTSIETVKTQSKDVRGKLKARTNSHAVALGMRGGLIH